MFSGTLVSEATPCSSEACRIESNSDLSAAFSFSMSSISFRLMPRRTVSSTCMVVGTPISAAIKASSSSSSNAASICFAPAKTVSILSESDSRVAFTARRNRAESSCSSAASRACNCSIERSRPSTDVCHGALAVAFSNSGAATQVVCV